jgi:hypothetical protein
VGAQDVGDVGVCCRQLDEQREQLRQGDALPAQLGRDAQGGERCLLQPAQFREGQTPFGIADHGIGSDAPKHRTERRGKRLITLARPLPPALFDLGFGKVGAGRLGRGNEMDLARHGALSRRP